MHPNVFTDGHKQNLVIKLIKTVEKTTTTSNVRISNQHYFLEKVHLKNDLDKKTRKKLLRIMLFDWLRGWVYQTEK